MTLLPSGVKIHVALGVTDMRKGLDGLAMLVQGTLKQDPFSGHLFVFRGRKAKHTSFYIPITVRRRSLPLASAARPTSACSAAGK
jgi:IS66 Orf2 like protein